MGLFGKKSKKTKEEPSKILISRMDKIDERLKSLHEKLDKKLEDNKACSEQYCRMKDLNIQSN